MLFSRKPKITLIKVSWPGWEKEFDTVAELKTELWSHICGMCRAGEDCDPEEYPPLTKDSLLVDIWATGCGCEFDFDDPHGLMTPLS